MTQRKVSKRIVGLNSVGAGIVPGKEDWNVDVDEEVAEGEIKYLCKEIIVVRWNCGRNRSRL
jgi:hypothetical protein